MRGARSHTRIAIGSEAHKELFCRMLLETYDPYQPAVIPWPPLGDAALERLRNLPFWGIAVGTEGQAAMRIAALAQVEHDPLLREAIALQEFEESRHQQVLEAMLRYYDIPFCAQGDYRISNAPEWEFLRMGYAECFDSFFAFGLFRLAKDSGFFPPELVAVFEPVIQEEARHLLFFVNWVAYCQAQRPPWQRPAFLARRLAAFTLQASARLRLGKDASGKSFTLAGQETVAGAPQPRAFLALCLAENERRLGQYDRRLLRPRIVPSLVRLAVSLWPGTE